MLFYGVGLHCLGWVEKNQRADLSQMNQGETLYNIKGYVKTPTTCYCNLHVL